MFAMECKTPSPKLRRTGRPPTAVRVSSTSRLSTPEQEREAPVYAALRAAVLDDPVRAGLVAWLLAYGLFQLVLASSSGHIVVACAACLSATPALSHGGRLTSAAAARLGPSVDYPFGLARAYVVAGFGTSIVVGAVLLMLIFEAFECLLAPSRPCDLGCIALAATNVFSHAAALLLDHPLTGGLLARLARGLAPSRAGAYGSADALPGMERAPRTALLASCAALTSTVACYLLATSSVDALGAVVLAAHALRALVWPLLEGCALILLQASPPHLREGLAGGLRAVSALDGVVEVQESRFWAVGPADCVASLRVRLRNDAGEQAIVAGVRSHFAALVTSLTVEIDKDEWLM